MAKRALKTRCHKCNNTIHLEKDKFVLLGTYNVGVKKGFNETYFHFECFVRHWNEQLILKTNIVLDHALNSPVVKNLIKDIDSTIKSLNENK